MSVNSDSKTSSSRYAEEADEMRQCVECHEAALDMSLDMVAKHPNDTYHADSVHYHYKGALECQKKAQALENLALLQQPVKAKAKQAAVEKDEKDEKNTE